MASKFGLERTYGKEMQLMVSSNLLIKAALPNNDWKWAKKPRGFQVDKNFPDSVLAILRFHCSRSTEKPYFRTYLIESLSNDACRT